MQREEPRGVRRPVSSEAIAPPQLLRFGWLLYTGNPTSVHLSVRLSGNATVQAGRPGTASKAARTWAVPCGPAGDTFRPDQTFKAASGGPFSFQFNKKLLRPRLLSPWSMGIWGAWFSFMTNCAQRLVMGCPTPYMDVGTEVCPRAYTHRHTERAQRRASAHTASLQPHPFCQ